MAENCVKLPTICKGQGLIWREILPGIYMAESITMEIKCTCITSIANTLEDVTTDALLAEELLQAQAMVFATTLVEDGTRLTEFRKELRTNHISSEERISLIRISEEYNLFHL
jgi:hypothetical protein